MKKAQDAAIASGMVVSHVDIIAGVAKQMNAAIMVRQVNKDSTRLIEEGFTTKDLHVKGKSSNWGPQAGFICCDQALSKLAKKDLSLVPAFNGKIKESISQGYAVAVPLLVSADRVRELMSGGRIKQLNTDKGVMQVTCMGKPHQVFQLYPVHAMPTGTMPLVYKKHMHVVTRLCADIPALKTGCWVLYDTRQIGESAARWEPVMVLAEKKSGIPLTADYDLFSICPHLGTTGFQKQADAKQNFRMAANSVRNALGTYDRRAVDIDLGRITAFSRQVKDQINNGITATGCRRVVHHGCEVDNPVTELDYPVTTIMPSGEVVAAENQQELEAVVRDLHRLGYAFYANRLWSQKGEVTSTTKVKQDYQWNDRVETQGLGQLEVLSPT